MWWWSRAETWSERTKEDTGQIPWSAFQTTFWEYRKGVVEPDLVISACSRVCAKLLVHVLQHLTQATRSLLYLGNRKIFSSYRRDLGNPYGLHKG